MTTQFLNILGITILSINIMEWIASSLREQVESALLVSHKVMNRFETITKNKNQYREFLKIHEPINQPRTAF